SGGRRSCRVQELSPRGFQLIKSASALPKADGSGPIRIICFHPGVAGLVAFFGLIALCSPIIFAVTGGIDEGWEWPIAILATAGAVAAAVQVNLLWRWIRSSFGCSVYFTPLHFIKIEFEEIAYWPVS